ncbi:hypothetical protein V8F06_004197 [Rhypophila decipiens]
MATRQFLFVNSGNPSKGEHKISTTGRAFVIRKARAAHGWSTKSKTKRQHQEEIRSGFARAAASGAATTTPEDSTGRHHHETRQRSTARDGCQYDQDLPIHTECRSCRFSDDRSILSQCKVAIPASTEQLGADLGPLRAMPLDLDRLDMSLLAYYHVADNCLSPRICLLDSASQSLEVHQYWKTMSLDSPGFMHGILCIAAVKLALVQPTQAPELVKRFMYHRIQAMAAIRRNLADPKVALSDDSLASVFNMVCSEEILALESQSQGLALNPAWALLGPDDTQREAHVVGWKRMLALRGGLRSLSTRLQSFVVRWGFGALANLLMSMYSLPHMYRSPQLGPPGLIPGSSNKTPYTTCLESQVTGQSDYAVARFLPAQRALPSNILSRHHRYPETSHFAHVPSRMADSCSRVHMHPGLVKLIFTIHCMIRDGMAWLCDKGNYSWDQYQVQNMFATGVGELVRWIYDHELVLSSPEGVTALTVFVFLLISCDGQHSVCGPLPGLMPRLRQQIQESGVRKVLQQAGIDTWVAVVLLIATRDSTEFCKKFFLQYYLDTVATRSPPIRTFEDLLASVEDCLWTPAMSAHARKVYNTTKTHTEWERLRNAVGAGSLSAILGDCDCKGEPLADASLYRSSFWSEIAEL